METYRPWLEEGFRRAGNGKSLKEFEIQASTSVTITDDVRAAFRTLRTWERGVAWAPASGASRVKRESTEYA